jgi:nucleoside-diphosphate-sugar epimerase
MRVVVYGADTLLGRGVVGHYEALEAEVEAFQSDQDSINPKLKPDLYIYCARRGRHFSYARDPDNHIECADQARVDMSGARAADACLAKRVVFVGSSAVYDDTFRGEAARLAESAFAKVRGATSIIRMFEVDDPGTELGIVNRLLSAARFPKFSIYENPDTRLDLIDYESALAAVLSDRTPLAPFDVGSGSLTTIRELCSLVARVKGRQDNPEFSTSAPVSGPERPAHIATMLRLGVNPKPLLEIVSDHAARAH